MWKTIGIYSDPERAVDAKYIYLREHPIDFGWVRVIQNKETKNWSVQVWRV